MSLRLIHQLYAGLAPWLVLALLLTGRNPFPTRVRGVTSLIIALLLLQIPLGGWSLFSWIRTLEPNPSLTLSGLLVVVLWQRFRGAPLFRSEDWSVAWIAGALSALILYPIGLGLTSVDTYAWGWQPFLPIALACCATWLLILGNRFGILLVLVPLGSLLHLQESANFWDALVDPFYGALSLVMVSLMILGRARAVNASFAEQASPSGKGGG
jgi:hypothetical protein